MAESDPAFEPPVAAAAVAGEAPTPAKAGKRWRNVALIASVPLLLIGAAVGYYLLNRDFVSTDNAYVQQDKVSVSALVGGPIVAVAVRENQIVRPGDLLFRIDPEP